MISTEELEQANQIMMKQFKNRNNDVNNPRRFIVGIDRSKMRLYNIDPAELEAMQEKEEEPEDEKKFYSKKKDVSDWKF